MSHHFKDYLQAGYFISIGYAELWTDAEIRLWHAEAYIYIYSVGRHTLSHTCKYAHKSNTACLSQEIIAVINVLAHSHGTALIG